MRRLLDAGTEVFSRRGYHSARVDDIVKTAATSHGTFYLYFSNKEELLAALATEVAAELAELAESLGPLTPDDDGYRELRDWLGRFADVHARSAPIIGAWTEAETGASEAGRLGNDVLGRLAASLSERIRASGEADVPAGLAALAIVAMVERFLYYASTGIVRAARDDVLDTLASATHTGLFASRPRAGVART
jgi:AcrR family transcriptional regulator